MTLKEKSSSTRLITEKVLELYENIVDKNFLIRRINVTANNVSAKNDEKVTYEQLDIFSYLNNKDGMQKSESKEDERSFKREESIQNAMLNIKEKYGKNAIMRGSNLLDKSTMIERNNQIGGHKA